MKNQTQSPRLEESISRLVGSIVPQNFLFKTYPRSIDVDIIQVQTFPVKSEIIIRQFSVISPILDSPQVKGMQINRHHLLCLGDGLNIVLFEQIQYIFTDLDSIEIAVHLRILGLDQNASQSAVRISLPLVLLVERDDHLNDLAQKREGKLIIEDGQPPRSLRLLDPQGLELSNSKLVGPPVSFPGAVIRPRLVPRGELGLLLDVGDPRQEGIVHDQQLLLLSVHHVQLDEIRALVQCRRKSLKSILRKNGTESPVGDVERTAPLLDIGSSIWPSLQNDSGGKEKKQSFDHINLITPTIK